MRSLLTIAAATVLALTAGGEARAQRYYQDYYRPQTDPTMQIMDNWFRHFLGRPPKQGDVDNWVPILQRQEPQQALAHLLASDEYLQRNGGTGEGLVLGMYRDVLGRTQLRRFDVDYWVNK